jgi:hypothetical protein
MRCDGSISSADAMRGHKVSRPDLLERRDGRLIADGADRARNFVG